MSGFCKISHVTINAYELYYTGEMDQSKGIRKKTNRFLIFRLKVKEVSGGHDYGLGTPLQVKVHRFSRKLNLYGNYFNHTADRFGGLIERCFFFGCQSQLEHFFDTITAKKCRYTKE